MEPFKNKFSVEVIEHMGHTFSQICSAFEKKLFVELASNQLDNLELKQRSEQITQALLACLPSDYDTAIEAILNSLAPMRTLNDVDDEAGFGLHGWAIMPICDVVVALGINNDDRFEVSLDTLFCLTMRFSAEFAIRPFLHDNPEKTLEVLNTRLNDPSHHVRRLISEGTRPRLPWGMRLPKFIEQPKLVLPILKKLRDDPSEYVRRSVANNLNDIAKDHPNMVAGLATEWSKGANPNRNKLIKHACRTLLKQGHPTVLSLYGYLPAELKSAKLQLNKNKLHIGDSICLYLNLLSSSKKNQKLLVDYIVYHQKANGSLQPKVFKWRTIELSPNASIELSKEHSFKPVTTRKYYQGLHKIAVLINGKEFESTSFELVI